MRNVLKLLAGAAFLAGATAASAQTSNSTLSAGRSLESISAADVQAMLTEFEIGSELQPSNAGRAPSVLATTEGGAKFLIGFFECASIATASGCKQALISTAQASGGVSFEDLNQFNGVSSVTTVVYDAGNQILIFGRNVFMPGGVGRDNFKLQIALFLRDMQTFIEGRQTTAAQVAFTVRPRLEEKISSVTGAGETRAAIAKFLISDDGSTEVALAINNSVDKSFAPGGDAILD